MSSATDDYGSSDWSHLLMDYDCLREYTHATDGGIVGTKTFYATASFPELIESTERTRARLLRASQVARPLSA